MSVIYGGGDGTALRMQQTPLTGALLNGYDVKSLV
jgi:hypothetical protein